MRFGDYDIVDCDIDPPYRYSLVTRTRVSSGAQLTVVQCNPSAASTERSDATVGKVSHWAAERGYARVVFLNLFALIGTDPQSLMRKRYARLVGPRNDAVIRECLTSVAGTAVLAWGGMIPISKKYYVRRVGELRGLLDDCGVLPHRVGALSGGGYPRHGRMWNGVNRELLPLDWEAVGR